MKKLTIIIPAFNAEKTIEKCLNSLKKQTENQFEVILVNDGSTDETTRIARKFQFVQIISQKNKGISFSRNIGAKKAKTPLIAFLDADVFVEKNWVKKIIKAMEQEVFCVSGTNKGEINGSIESDFFAFTIGSSAFQGYNIAFKRKNFLELKFNEKFKYSEEPEFFFKAFEQEKKLKQIEAIAFHSSYSFWNRFERNFEYSKWDAKTLKKYFNLIAKNPLNFLKNAPTNIKFIALFYSALIASILLIIIFSNLVFLFLPAILGIIQMHSIKQKTEFRNSFLAISVYAFFAITVFSWIKFLGFLIGLIKK